jgi:hypothetical protein
MSLYGNYEHIMALVIIMGFMGPLILALIHSPTSFFIMLLSIIPYYMMLPTMVVFLGAFSFSRVWDISWGNRPSERCSLKSTLSEAEIKANKKNIEITGISIGYSILFINILIIILFLNYSNIIASAYRLAIVFLIFSFHLLQMIFSVFYFANRFATNLQRLNE